MPWRLECRTCKSKSKLNVKDKPLRETCATPHCGGVMEPVVHRAGPKLTADWQAAADKRRERAANQRRAARQAMLEMHRQTEEDEKIAVETDEKEGKRPPDEDDADPLYLPSADFRPGLRLSSTGYAGRQNVVTLGGTKAQTWHRVAAKAGRGNQALVMGAHHGRGTLTATDWVTEQKQNPGTLDWEWCHLIADSLGGATAHDNLVAGGYHANTAMLYIEMACKGRSELEVQVTAALSAPDVAEVITYEIRLAKQKKVLFTRTIDSRTPGFAQADAEALARDLAPVRAAKRGS